MKLSTQHITLVHCCLLWSVVSAAGPQPAYFSAYATVDENTFYIQGGSNFSDPSIIYDQFYSLDLTQSWNVTNPPWSALAVGLVPARLKTVFHSISLSSNRKTLTFWDMYSLSPYSANYHLDTNAWEVLPAPLSLQPSGFKIAKAATDPTTDHVYIPGSIGNNSTLAYDPVSKNLAALADPPAVNGKSISWNGYTFVWSELRKSFLLFGGLATPASSYLYEYKPTAASPWKALKANGALPPLLVGSCMVPAYNGTKMILFGGTYNSSVYIDTLYILDVATLKWSQGGKHQPRLGATCSVSGDYLLVWGGTSVDNTGKSAPVADTPDVYNINTAQWTSTFIAKKKATPPTTVMTKPTATHPLGSKDTGVGSPATGGEMASNNSISANIGGAVGAGVVFILIAIGVVFRRRRSHRQQQKKEMQEDSTSQARPNQKNGQDLIEKMYARHILPSPEPAITPRAAVQSAHSANYSPNIVHSGSPQQGYCQGLQRDPMDSYSRLTPSPPQRIKSSVSTRSTSTLVATPSMANSSRYPSSPQSYFFDPAPLSQRNMRNPQDHSTLSYQEYYTPDSTPNNSQWIQNKINALQAEANRLETMLHP